MGWGTNAGRGAGLVRTLFLRFSSSIIASPDGKTCYGWPCQIAQSCYTDGAMDSAGFSFLGSSSGLTDKLGASIATGEGPFFSRRSPSTKGCKMQALTCEQILLSPTTSHWLKEAIRAQSRRDPADSVNDAEMLLAVMKDRFARACSAGL